MVAGSGKPLLIELGTEELPPKALDNLAAAFAGGISDGLVKAGVLKNSDGIRTLCTPRRLAVYFPNVATMQAEQQQERRGPALSAALDKDGNATKALSGFAASCGVAVDALEKLETDKGSWFVYRATAAGKATADLLSDIVNEAIAAMPIPKPMRWGNHDYAFVRPAHWLVMLHGADIIDGEVLGIRSGRATRGHRFHHPEPIEIANANEWLDCLRDMKVLADQDERRQRVRNEVAKVTPKGMTARLGDELLDEIANLTEWPVAIACAFDAEFLDVPHEALVLTMETNQKFVPVFSADGELTEHFIGVANIESKDPAEIRKGYERVIRPRFADAKFFYEEDRKVPLESYQAALKSVTYQQQLGSVWDKTVRVAELARVIANRVGVDAGAATRAAALAKCDLVTRMVGEFPELQGVMGRTYASQGEKPEASDVAAALDEFYQPRFGGDVIASGKVGQVLAIAERIDTLVGIFAVGMKPSGNKDPFALRRAALGLARTLVEGKLDLDLHVQLIEASEAVLAALPTEPPSKASKPRPSASELTDDVFAFVLDRMRGYYADQDIGIETFDAVRVTHPHSLLDFDRRIHAVHEFAALPEAKALAAANKRIGNILRQSDQAASANVNRDLLEAGAETTLADELERIATDAAKRIESRDYVGLLRLLSSLGEPVDAYFDAVMVMDDDPALRANRLALLGRLRNLFLHVADISMLPNS
ncbi:MAG: glycine--tRNA ligase subunit beta [Dokdonella sp.]